MDIKGTVINFDDITPSAIGATNTEVLSNAEYEALETIDENTLYIISDGIDEIGRMNMHIKNNFIHVTAAEKEKWNNVDFSAIEVELESMRAELDEATEVLNTRLAATPQFSSGPTDLEAGTTPLEEYEFYFVYE